MTTFFLCSINARYNHTNLAIRTLGAYAKANHPELSIQKLEWSINQPLEDMIRESISSLNEIHFSIQNNGKNTNTTIFPVFMFSVYLWNCELTFKLADALKKILSNSFIIFGGPEVSYKPESVFSSCKAVDVISEGEGEKTIAELSFTLDSLHKEQFQSYEHIFLSLSKVKGLFLRDLSQNSIFYTGRRDLIQNLSEIPFAYGSYALPENRDIKECIVYYETSRGCPYSCAYCLSSIDKSVRYLPIERVLDELQFFLDNKFRLIKFVDRTFNLNPERYTKIWKYIIEHHNGITSFHFEIEARNLTDEAFEVLKDIKPGIIQFEIGIQSSNVKTLKAVNRSTDLETISTNIKKIPENIHVHLDLISGLPEEDIKSFEKSYDYAIAFKPEQLQCGFLKVLSGSPIQALVNKSGWEYLSYPPYEVLKTPYLSFDDICTLKGIDHLTEIYYNTDTFKKLMFFLISKESLFSFFINFSAYLKENGGIFTAHKTVDYFQLLFNFLTEKYTSKPYFDFLIELLRFDFIRQAKTSSFPQWYEHNYSKEKHAHALFTNTNVKSTRESYAYSDYEEFDINPLTLEKEKTQILFIYASKEKRIHNYSTQTKTRFIILK